MAVHRFSASILEVTTGTTEGVQGATNAVLPSGTDGQPDYAQAFAVLVHVDPEPEGEIPIDIEGPVFPGEVPVLIETSADGQTWVPVPLVPGESVNAMYQLGALALHIRASLEPTDEATTASVVLCSSGPFRAVAA